MTHNTLLSSTGEDAFVKWTLRLGTILLIGAFGWFVATTRTTENLNTRLSALEEIVAANSLIIKGQQGLLTEQATQNSRIEQILEQLRDIKEEQVRMRELLQKHDQRFAK